jgi:hypothetical protein
MIPPVLSLLGAPPEYAFILKDARNGCPASLAALSDMRQELGLSYLKNTHDVPWKEAALGGEAR